MALDDLTGAGVELRTSPVETARFGVSVGRLTVGCDLPADGTAFDAAAAAIADALARSPDDIVVVRYPADVVRLGAVLAASGRDLIPAGALTYWGADARDIVGKSTEELGVISANQLGGSVADVAEVLDAVIADSFAGYANHYLADPLLHADAALAGYQDWARRSIAAGRDVLVLFDAETPIGIATLVASGDGRSHLEVLLAGLVKAAQGQGRYAALLLGCAAEARQRGLRRLVISTQVHNVRVQRAWARLGLRPFIAVETVHSVRRGLLDPYVNIGYRSADLA